MPCTSGLESWHRQGLGRLGGSREMAVGWDGMVSFSSRLAEACSYGPRAEAGRALEAGVGSGTTSTPLHSVGQSKSPGLVGFQGREIDSTSHCSEHSGPSQTERTEDVIHYFSLESKWGWVGTH